MTKIDFYILAEDSYRSVKSLTCQLTEKAYKQNNFVYIQSQSTEQANDLDELLWKYKPESFLPHIQATNRQAKFEGSFNFPILINSSNAIAPDYNPENLTEVLINLGNSPPEFFSQFHRLAEIIDKDKNSKQLARQRFRFYKDRGYHIATHNL